MKDHHEDCGCRECNAFLVGDTGRKIADLEKRLAAAERAKEAAELDRDRWMASSAGYGSDAEQAREDLRQAERDRDAAREGPRPPARASRTPSGSLIIEWHEPGGYHELEIEGDTVEYMFVVKDEPSRVTHATLRALAAQPEKEGGGGGVGEQGTIPGRLRRSP